MTEMLFSNADIAVALNVTRAAVSNWLSRYDDTPPPTYQTTDGRTFWDRDGLAAWIKWHDERHASVEDDGTERQAVMRRIVAEIRSQQRTYAFQDETER